MTIYAVISWGGLRLSPLLYQPRMMDDDYYATAGGLIGRGNLNTARKRAPELLCPPQIPRDLIRARTGPPKRETSD
jgi:hypothetical protein